VPIFYKVCEHTRLAPRQRALGYLHDVRVLGKNMRGVCQECLFNPAALKESVLQKTKGNGQKKRPRGPTPGSYATITEHSLRRSFEKLGPYATQEQVAELLDVTDRGIRDWQKSRKLKWRQVQQQYSQTGSS
jgi:hypothetical protein